MEDNDKFSGEFSKRVDEIDSVTGASASKCSENDTINKNEDIADNQHHVEQIKTDSENQEAEHSESSENKDTSNQMSHRHRLSSSERSNTITEESYIVPPKVNCSEKIIFCVDASAEMEKLTFRSRAGDKLSPKHLTKKCLSIFLQSKNKVDKKHEFALMLLRESCTWVRDFTNNPRDILIGLEDSVENEVCEMCDIGSVFDNILEKIDVPKVQGDISILPPPYCIRLILIYGRSNSPLEFTKKESFNLLNSSPYFYLDVIYIHDPAGEENNCQTVFDSICDLDQTGQSYIFSLSRNPTKLYSHMAQLVAHPLQRPLQNDVSYRIGSSVPQPENG